MSLPILATKLFPPPPRAGLVARPHLIARLDAGLAAGSRLTLISAAAGCGKTTLVSQWLTNAERRTQNAERTSSGSTDPVLRSTFYALRSAWLSLDAGDGDLTRFLTYLVAALQTLVLSEAEGLAAPIGAGVLGALQSPQPPTTEAILTALLNDIAGIPANSIVVLDDYHVIDSPAVDQALAFLVEHMPPQLHLVIATREDPSLPLARLRARDQLTELRAADLRFTPAEAAAFLTQVMGLSLAADEIAALEARTEGWIAGLQLAALSMRGREDIASFIRAFTGSHRFVLDYLVEEVLQQQPEHIQSFLLRTSILDRMCGPLCDALMKAEGLGLSADASEPQPSAFSLQLSTLVLAQLERANLFIVPLDDQRQWYRYHHLFAEVLQAHLQEAQPDRVSTLHLRASGWYEQNGLRPDAIRHALAARDFECAADLIELARPAMDLGYQSATWLGWVRALPDGLIRARPVLSVGYAWALLDGGDLEASEARLQDAERWMEAPTDGMVVVDSEQFRSLPASIATARAYRSLALGDIPGTVTYARQALERTPADDQTRHNQATSLLGLAQYTSGDLKAAERSLADFYTHLRKAGDISTLVGITFLLADIRVALGCLHTAESSYQQSLRLAAGQGGPMPLGMADLYRGLAGLSIEYGDLEAAAHHLLASQKLGEQTPVTDWPYRLCVSQACLKEAQGDLDGALALLDAAEHVHIRSPLPEVRPVAAVKARVWLKQGRLSEAVGWAREQGLAMDGDFRYTREFEHITLARVRIAQYKNDPRSGSIPEAIMLLERLLQAAEAGGRMGSTIEILVVHALALQAQGHGSQALASVGRALALAEPEGYVRTFVDEGQPMAELLERMKDEGGRRKAYIHRLLAAFGNQKEFHPSSFIPHPLSEPLSERELEVLRLLRSELSGPEIAEHLTVSLHTLRTHTNNIFKKLGVNNRRAAVRRAEELDL